MPEECRTAEFLFVRKFSRVKLPSSVTVTPAPGNEGGDAPSDDRSRVELLPESVLNVQESVAQTALGVFERETPSGDYCPASGFAAVQGEGTVSGSASYQFSDVQFYVTPRVPGVLLFASLEYTEEDASPCSGAYDVKALFPATYCSPEDDEAVRDVSMCGEESTGILSDIPLRCDAPSGLCVLGAPPAGQVGPVCNRGRMDDCAKVAAEGECEEPGVCTRADGQKCLRGGDGVLDWPCRE